jgi:hypothetical protein
MATAKKNRATFTISYATLSGPGEVVSKKASKKTILKHMFCKYGTAHWDADAHHIIVLAKKSMTVWVTKAIISRANRRDALGCAVALAIRAALGPQYMVRVWQTCVMIRDLETLTELRFRLQTPVSAAIKRFDKNKEWDLPPGPIELLPYRPTAKPKSKTEGKSRMGRKIRLEIDGDGAGDTTVIIKRKSRKKWKRSAANRARTVTRAANIGRRV